MNSLVLLPEEIDGDGVARLRGDRAIHAYETHELRAGAQSRCAVLGGKLGTAKVLSSSRDLMELSVECTTQPPSRLSVTLVVGVSRPQTMKKVLQGASMAGVTEVRFIGAEKAEKSYFQSRATSPEEVKRQIVLGLEQVWDCIPPAVVFHHSLRTCLDSLASIPGESQALRIIADVQGGPLDFAGGIASTQSVIILIGPELGWSSSEIETARNAGYLSARIGTRAVRVEVAMSYFLGVVAYERGRRELEIPPT